MARMEGPLSKWTNVMKGWQFRWFVLDVGAGLLLYYTSKEKMVRGAQRGCIRLKGAVVGIDDDDDSTFIITVDGKTFHFQARDSDEREWWIRALEDTILKHAASFKTKRPSKNAPTMEDFDKKLIESDAYLQILIDHASIFEKNLLAAEDPETKQKCQDILTHIHGVLESVKHSIVLLQIAKNTAFPVNGIYHPCNAVQESLSSSSAEISQSVDSADDGKSLLVIHELIQSDVEVGDECSESISVPTPPSHCILSLDDPVVPTTSYTSSEDEDFFDADDFAMQSQSPSGPRLFEDALESVEGKVPLSYNNEGGGDDASYISPLSELPPCKSPPDYRPSPLSSEESKLALISSSSIDYDAMYDDDDEADLGSMESHGSVIQHLISQVKIGMDLTKVVLPTFILERRSLLEMYADFFAHPDLFSLIADMSDPKERMVQVLMWYLSAFHAGRKSEVAKKPYNPILGEVFRCYWENPLNGANKSDALVTDGPVPWSSPEQLSFVAEQVSHHPPISAFYAEHFSKRISFCGHIWTKSKFLGLSVCVQNIGQGCVSLLDLDEEYIINFPSGYGRSILTVPWVELGGMCQITCSRTGFNANIEFLTKPFYGGKKHRISAEVFSPGEKKPFLVVEGEWNGVMNGKWSDGRTETLIDTRCSPITKKSVRPIMQQDPNESRFMWRKVTAGLKMNAISEATESKFALEQRQREEAKQRKEAGVSWEPKLFSLVGDNWIYNNPLQKRLAVR